MRFLIIIAIAVLTFASHNVSALPVSTLDQAGESLQGMAHLTKRNPLEETDGIIFDTIDFSGLSSSRDIDIINESATFLVGMT
jgi:hypothetical protein